MEICKVLRGVWRGGGSSLLLLMIFSMTSVGASILRSDFSYMNDILDSEPVLYSYTNRNSNAEDRYTIETEEVIPNVPISEDSPYVFMTTGASQSYRLPKSLKPTHYNLKIQPFIHGNQSISGTVEIDFDVIEPTSSITVHAKLMVLKISEIKLEEGLGNSPIPVPSIVHFSADNEPNFFTAHLSEELTAGRSIRYSIPFISSLENWGEGFFTFQYNDNDENKTMMASLNHAFFARQAFPCLDEPSFKANFSLQVAREVNMKAISNMEVEESISLEGQPGWVVDRFKTSPQMAPYQIMLVITPFNYVQVQSSTGFPIKVWGRDETLNNSSVLMDVIKDLVDYFVNCTGSPFPLPKLDLIAVPANSPAAYGGLGVIQFYSDKKIYSKTEDPVEYKTYLTKLTAHQLALKWFGGLVSPKWWSDIWLSKGFASYLYTKAAATVHPEGAEDMRNRKIELIQRVKAIDSKPYADQPIHFDVQNPVEDEPRMFNMITYHKGAALVQMMKCFLTSATFTKGVRNYLQKYKYDSANQYDLFAELTKVAHQDGTLEPDLNMTTIMNTWTLQPGYPVIKVIRDEFTGNATVTQEKFIVVRGKKIFDRRGNKWWIPLTYTTQAEPNFENTQVQDWIPRYQNQIQIDNLGSSDEWVLFNIKTSGYYRVNYDDLGWTLLTEQLATDHKVIHVVNRAQLIDDALELALAGDLNYKIAMNVSSYLSQEEDRLPWETFNRKVKRIEGLLHNTPARGALRKYVLSLLVPIYSKFNLGSVKDIRRTQRRHAAMVSLACIYGYPNCVDLAKSLYSQWMDNQGDMNAVHSWLRKTVLCTAIAHGGEAEFNFAVEKLNTTTDNSIKKNLRQALGCKKTSNQQIDTSEVFDETATDTTEETVADVATEAIVETTDQIPTDGTETDGTITRGTETDGTQTDGSQTDGTQTDESQTDGTETDESQTDGSQTDGTQTDGTETEGTVGGFRDEIIEDHFDDSWNTITSRWKQLSPLLGENGVEELVLSATESFNTPEDIEKLVRFRDEHRDYPGVARALDTAVRRAEDNLAFRERYSGVISEWLSDQGFLN